MTESEQKKFRHILARFEGVKHSSVDVVDIGSLLDGCRSVVAKIRGYKKAYVFRNDRVETSWRCV